ncbi:MAG: hypothetical protein IPG38_15135 [Chitinophagaceae bacterium]|nr:hypothetical protein [Chitinophagaceae bacterium]
MKGNIVYVSNSIISTSGVGAGIPEPANCLQPVPRMDDDGKGLILMLIIPYLQNGPLELYGIIMQQDATPANDARLVMTGNNPAYCKCLNLEYRCGAG